MIVESLDAINERMAIELKVMEQNLDLDDQLEAYESLLVFENGEVYEEEEAPEDWEEYFCPEEEAELSF